MKRGKSAGIVWRPVEWALLAIAVFLSVVLLWSLRETERYNTQEAAIPPAAVEDESDISRLLERGVQAEEAVDFTYDSWEQASSSAIDSAADDIGGVYDESSY